MVIIDSPLFTEMILPFLLVFVLIFAILQKSKVLGEGKAQIDALISLAIALILIGVPVARDVIVGIIPWLAVGVAVILVFMILYGFAAGDLKTGETWMKIVFGILAGLFVIGTVIYVTGLWDSVSGIFSGGSDLWANIVIIIIVVGAVAFAIASGKSSDSGGSTESE